MNRGRQVVVYGVDVGVDGAIALMVDGQLRDVADLPSHVASTGSVKRRVDPAGLASIVRNWRAAYPDCAELAVMERVSAMPKQGTSSVFSLGHSLGVCQSVFAALGIRHELVMPSVWKHYMGLRLDKSESQALASQRFPEQAGLWVLAKHHDRAEAALIAHYGAVELA